MTISSRDEAAVMGMLRKAHTASRGHVEGKNINVGGLKTKIFEGSYNLDGEYEYSIIRPLKSKMSRYGNRQNPSLFDVTMLLHSNFRPICTPFFSGSEWQSFQLEQRTFLESLGYKGIYFIDQRMNILVYSRK